MKKFKFFVLFVLLKIISCENDGIFTVVGSNLFKFRDHYRASVVYKGFNEAKELSLKIKTKNAQESSEEEKKDVKNFEITQKVTLSGSGVQNVDFDVSILSENKCDNKVKNIKKNRHIKVAD